MTIRPEIDYSCQTETDISLWSRTNIDGCDYGDYMPRYPLYSRSTDLAIGMLKSFWGPEALSVTVTKMRLTGMPMCIGPKALLVCTFYNLLAVRN